MHYVVYLYDFRDGNRVVVNECSKRSPQSIKPQCYCSYTYSLHV